MTEKIIRFYAKKIDGKVSAIPGQKIEEILPELEIIISEELEKYDYFEVKFNLSSTEQQISPLDTDYVRPDAINAAREFNEAAMEETNTSLNKVFDYEERMLLQEFVDRILFYKQDFIDELKPLLEKFPINGEFKNGVRVMN